MTPAEELRAAATRMRELAEKATPGPWGYDSYSRIDSVPLCALYTDRWDAIPDDAPDEAYEMLPDTAVAFVPVVAGDTATERGSKDAKHIAAWHPAVALAVADWLLTVENEMDVEAHRFETGDFPYTWFAALAVARAFLGGAS